MFAVLDQDDELVGEPTTEFFDVDDEYIEPEEVDARRLEDAEMWIGFGLRPDLTGRGLGTGFATACVEFAHRRHDYTGDYVRLAVAPFNKRAISVYKRAGFQLQEKVAQEIDGKQVEILWMRKRLTKRAQEGAPPGSGLPAGL